MAHPGDIQNLAPPSNKATTSLANYGWYRGHWAIHRGLLHIERECSLHFAGGRNYSIALNCKMLLNFDFFAGGRDLQGGRERRVAVGDGGRLRGPEHRPLCPGPLRDTHCLWMWYQRPATFRRGCWRPRPWERHKHMFGETEELQNLRKAQEARAWFDLIQTSNITCHL